mgnify:CR=1 FL=1
MNRAKGLREYYDNLKIVAEWEASKPEKVKKAKNAVDKWKEEQKEKDLIPNLIINEDKKIVVIKKNIELFKDVQRDKNQQLHFVKRGIPWKVYVKKQSMFQLQTSIKN